jgi:hypothetical protein
VARNARNTRIEVLRKSQHRLVRDARHARRTQVLGAGVTYALGADALQRVGDIVTQRARVYVY